MMTEPPSIFLVRRNFGTNQVAGPCLRGCPSPTHSGSDSEAALGQVCPAVISRLSVPLLYIKKMSFRLL